MIEKNEDLVHNEAHFNRDVEKGAGSTIPCLDLDRDMVHRFARGELDPEPTSSLAKRGHFPGIDLAAVAGKDVLLLGAGGGQQSAILGLLDARVTVLELSQRQLDGDRAAAAHYGYEITAIHADMQEPSGLVDASFDIVYTVSTMYIPDIRTLCRECARVLRPHGTLTMGLLQPAHQARFLAGLISHDVYDPVNRHAVEYIHYMDDIFNGLVEAGLSLRQVVDAGRDKNHIGPVGSLEPAYVDDGGYFIVVATKPH